VRKEWTLSFLSLIHRSAWKGNSQKLVCRMPHGPARWPPYGRAETSRLLKVNHYMLHLRRMIRSGGCAASSQNTDADRGAGGYQELAPLGVLEEVRSAWARCVYKPI
jgi:hypothetical protein